MLNRSRTSSRKSTRQSDSKKKVSLCLSNWYSASTMRIGSPRCRTLSLQMLISSFSSSDLRGRRSASSRLARRVIRLRSAAHAGPGPPPCPPPSPYPAPAVGRFRQLALKCSADSRSMIWPRSSPRSASTLTKVPTSMSRGARGPRTK